jgi:hypothetical protein
LNTLFIFLSLTRVNFRREVNFQRRCIRNPRLHIQIQGITIQSNKGPQSVQSQQRKINSNQHFSNNKNFGGRRGEVRVVLFRSLPKTEKKNAIQKSEVRIKFNCNNQPAKEIHPNFLLFATTREISKIIHSK